MAVDHFAEELWRFYKYVKLYAIIIFLNIIIYINLVSLKRKLASYENLSYIDGLEYGEDTTEDDTQDSRKLVMFMRVTEEKTPASPNFNSQIKLKKVIPFYRIVRYIIWKQV